mmetsp:Transcript_19740/g.43153  ORF Transcript_19740/g.43153 Transcript_19740/m.43153 type:complete len:214 (+) Transcript_19740:118-759(+)
MGKFDAKTHSLCGRVPSPTCSTLLVRSPGALRRLHSAITFDPSKEKLIFSVSTQSLIRWGHPRPLVPCQRGGLPRLGTRRSCSPEALPTTSPRGALVPRSPSQVNGVVCGENGAPLPQKFPAAPSSAGPDAIIRQRSSEESRSISLEVLRVTPSSTDPVRNSRDRRGNGASGAYSVVSRRGSIGTFDGGGHVGRISSIESLSAMYMSAWGIPW